MAEDETDVQLPACFKELFKGVQRRDVYGRHRAHTQHQTTGEIFEFNAGEGLCSAKEKRACDLIHADVQRNIGKVVVAGVIFIFVMPACHIGGFAGVLDEEQAGQQHAEFNGDHEIKDHRQHKGQHQHADIACRCGLAKAHKGTPLAHIVSDNKENGGDGGHGDPCGIGHQNDEHQHQNDGVHHAGNRSPAAAFDVGGGSGNAGGRGGVNHLCSMKHNMLGFSATLACDLGLANGAGMKIQYDGTDNIVYVFYGDGTSNRGPVHEAMNMAGAWKMPVLFVCQNNQFAISTPASEGSSVPNPGADRAAAYGMPTAIADGTDVLSVYEAAKGLVDYVRSGKGPALLECKHYRWRGHFEGDMAAYRDKSVTDDYVQNKDCVARMEKLLLDEGMIDQATIDAMYKKLDDELEAAVAFGEASPSMTLDEIYDNLYV